LEPNPKSQKRRDFRLPGGSKVLKWKNQEHKLNMGRSLSTKLLGVVGQKNEAVEKESKRHSHKKDGG